MPSTFDVVEVDIAAPNAVRILARGLDAANAEAVMLMAIARRGVEHTFFKIVPSGSREEGEFLMHEREATEAARAWLAKHAPERT